MTTKEKADRLLEVAIHFAKGGVAIVKDIDGVVKESRIVAVYSDHTVDLGDTIESIHSIFKITLKPL